MLSSCCKLSRCVSKALPGQAGATSCRVLGRCRWPQPFVASPAVAAGCSCSPKPPLNLLGKPPAPAAAAGALGYFHGVMEFLLPHRAASTGNKRVDTTNTAARRRWWGCLMPTSVGVFFSPRFALISMAGAGSEPVPPSLPALLCKHFEVPLVCRAYICYVMSARN